MVFRRVALGAVFAGLVLLTSVIGMLRMAPLSVTVGSRSIALVQSGPIVSTNGTVIAGTLPAPSQAGTTLIAIIAAGQGGAPIVSSVPAGFTQWVNGVESTHAYVQFLAYANNPGGINAVQFAMSVSVSPWYVHLSEWNATGIESFPAFWIPNIEAEASATATSGSSLTLVPNNLAATGISQSGELAFVAWIQDLAAPATVTLTPAPGYTRLVDNGSISASQHLAIDYQIGLPVNQTPSIQVSSTGASSSAAGLMISIIPAPPAVDETAYLQHDSLSIKQNTFDFGLMLGGKLLLEDGTGGILLEDGSGYLLLDTYVPQLGDPVTVANPSWNGRVVSVELTDLTDRQTNYRLARVTASNQAVAPGGTAPGDFSDSPTGGYLLLEDGTGGILLEDGSGRLLLEGSSFSYRHLSVRTSQNQDGTVTTYGSLETFEGGFAGGQTFLLTSTNLGYSAQQFTITNVTTLFLHQTPVYLVEFGDAYQTLQKAGGGVLINQGSQAAIQQGVVMPGGVLAYAKVVTSQTGITSAVDLTGLSVTVNVLIGRRIRITGSALLSSTMAADTGWLGIYEGATQLRTTQVSLANTSAFYGALVEVVLTPTTGVHTYKLQAQRYLGTGSVTMTATSTDPAEITVEDLGT